MSLQWFSILLIMIGLPLSVSAQQWHSRISLKSQAGYATNSYLNDYLSEWEPSLTASYIMVSPEFVVSRKFGKNFMHFTGGAYYQPYLEGGYNSWRGGFARIDANRRWNSVLYTGLQGGSNWYKYTYSRTLSWLEPYVRLNVSDDMELKFTWSYTSRNYHQLQADSSSERYNRVAIDYQWWPSYRWKLHAGVYGNLRQLEGGNKALSSYMGTTYWIKNDWNIKLRAGFEHYGFETTSKRSVGPRCDVYKGCSVNNRILITNEDDLYNLEVRSVYQLTPAWSVNISASYLRWISDDERTITSDTDKAFSVGVNYSIIPGWGGREEVQAPRIQSQEKQQTLFSIRYKGEGNLYLTGGFNNWERPGIPLVKGPDDTYRTTLKLQEGVYEYKVLKVEGGNTEWLKLDDSTIMVSDGFGGMNGRMVIE